MNLPALGNAAPQCGWGYYTQLQKKGTLPIMDKLVEVNNLTKQYGSYKAVNNVSFTLNKGDICGLIGKNGAGKSTLFKLLMDLSKPSEGVISFGDDSSMNGQRARKMEDIRQKIGFMMDTPFYPYLNATQNLQYIVKIKGIADMNAVSEVLDTVGLSGVKKPFKSFSMGMKQRLGIAKALLGNPEIIIMDEPTNGLDPQGIADFRNLVLEYNKKSNITFMISSHILGELGLMATRFLFIDKGIMIKEIDGVSLQNEARKAIIVKVDNPGRAVCVLQNEFQLADVKIENEDTIVIGEPHPPADLIAKCMIDNDLRLFALQPLQLTLEDYYLNLIGGSRNV